MYRSTNIDVQNNHLYQKDVIDTNKNKIKDFEY